MWQAGSGAVQAKDSNNIVTCGSASKYKTASKKRRTENPATRTSTRVLWREGLLVWALLRLVKWLALLSEEAAERDLGEIVGPLQEGDTVLLRGSEEIREGPA